MAGRVHAESNALSSTLRLRPKGANVLVSRTGFNISASASADSFCVYIVRCSDGSLYVGHTTNVQARVDVHNEGQGARWTACRRPVTLVYQESHASELIAIARERQIKRWTHDKKLALTNGDRETLKSLAKRKVR